MAPEPVPAHAGADAAGAALGQLRRHRRLRRAAVAEKAVPYALIAPAVLVIVAVLGYPIYFLVRLSFQNYGLFQLIAHKGQWVGLHNFSATLSDGGFWHVVLRTAIFTAVNVGLTLLLGTLIALLLKELGRVMRMAVTIALILAWAMPVVVAAQLWLWMTNYENGVFNYLLTELHFG